MLNRRRFLGHSCALGVTGATLGTTLGQLVLAREAVAQQAGDYRALVCILLAGGNDSYNMLVPTGTAQYNEYSAIRSDLALPANDLIALPGTASNGETYGVHPGMPELASLFANGEAALLANVGTLLEAVDAAAVESGAARVPVGLFSHADQINQWQTAAPADRIADGWGGRIADRMQNVNVANGISMNISLGGTNVFQSGNQAAEYSIDANGDGVVGINGYGENSEFGQFRTASIDALLGVNQQGLLRREYSQRLRSAIDAQSVFTSALSQAPVLTTSFGDSPFSQALRQIARVIGVRDQLGATRQTFFVQVGGWDHHDEVLNNQAAMLPMISQGISEFRNALVELGVFDSVTTFTTSDFGRTLTSNGRGSDHGWGGHHVVMGGAVNGGQIYGDYPMLAANSPLDVGRGIYIPTTSVDEYFAELALWFGVSTADLDYVLPNLRAFYTPGSPPPIGLMQTT
ncbi:MAG: DUF1501 domain-containing protein [Pseudomonadota bacterium]